MARFKNRSLTKIPDFENFNSESFLIFLCNVRCLTFLGILLNSVFVLSSLIFTQEKIKYLLPYFQNLNLHLHQYTNKPYYLIFILLHSTTIFCNSDVWNLSSGRSLDSGGTVKSFKSICFVRTNTFFKICKNLICSEL